MKKPAQQTPHNSNSSGPDLERSDEQLHLPGLQMQQDGGAHHRLTAAFDAKATPLVITIVPSFMRSRALVQLAGSAKFRPGPDGRVVVQFKLEYDGTVRDVEVIDNMWRSDELCVSGGD